MRFRPVPLLLSLAVVSLGGHAVADTPALSSNSPTVTRLLAEKKTMKWNANLNGHRYGHSEAIVAAPIDKVTKTVTDFNHYKELHPKFATARVIMKAGDETDVYVQHPIKIGLASIQLYEVLRFGALTNKNGTQVVEARGVKGDLRDAHTVITATPIDARHTLLQVDALFVPKLPAPQSFIDEELRDGAEDLVNGLKDKAQGFPGVVSAL
jgi:hypothetical protein